MRRPGTCIVRGHPRNVSECAETERRKIRNTKPSDGCGGVRDGVRAGIAVGLGVRRSTDPERIADEHQHSRNPAHGFAFVFDFVLRPRGCAEK